LTAVRLGLAAAAGVFALAPPRVVDSRIIVMLVVLQTPAQKMKK
jgi:hypothetical protein